MAFFNFSVFIKNRVKALLHGRRKLYSMKRNQGDACQYGLQNTAFTDREKTNQTAQLPVRAAVLSNISYMIIVQYLIRKDHLEW